jgi:hypothetical protein
LRRILALPIILFVLAVVSFGVIAQTDTKTNLPVAKEAQKSSEDTIPKSTTAPSKPDLKFVTVIGHKSDTKPGLEPITVSGHKLD